MNDFRADFSNLSDEEFKEMMTMACCGKEAFFEEDEEDCAEFDELAAELLGKP